jgi:hypothetical protein
VLTADPSGMMWHPACRQYLPAWHAGTLPACTVHCTPWRPGLISWVWQVLRQEWLLDRLHVHAMQLYSITALRCWPLAWSGVHSSSFCTAWVCCNRCFLQQQPHLQQLYAASSSITTITTIFWFLARRAEPRVGSIKKAARRSFCGPQPRPATMQAVASACAPALGYFLYAIVLYNVLGAGV